MLNNWVSGEAALNANRFYATVVKFLSSASSYLFDDCVIETIVS